MKIMAEFKGTRQLAEMVLRQGKLLLKVKRLKKASIEMSWIERYSIIAERVDCDRCHGLSRYPYEE